MLGVLLTANNSGLVYDDLFKKVRLKLLGSNRTFFSAHLIIRCYLIPRTSIPHEARDRIVYSLRLVICSLGDEWLRITYQIFLLKTLTIPSGFIFGGYNP
jgi:hypothetical protein